jgi:hypothetical protein
MGQSPKGNIAHATYLQHVKLEVIDVIRELHPLDIGFSAAAQNGVSAAFAQPSWIPATCHEDRESVGHVLGVQVVPELVLHRRHVFSELNPIHNAGTFLVVLSHELDCHFFLACATLERRTTQ